MYYLSCRWSSLLLVKNKIKIIINLKMILTYHDNYNKTVKAISIIKNNK